MAFCVWQNNANNKKIAIAVILSDQRVWQDGNIEYYYHPYFGKVFINSAYRMTNYSNNNCLFK